MSGNFSVNVAANGQTLVISYVGMKTFVEVAASNNMTVRLESDTETLEELLVVAFGTAKNQHLPVLQKL